MEGQGACPRHDVVWLYLTGFFRYGCNGCNGRMQAIELRVTFEKHRDVRDPRRVAAMLRQVEEEATKLRHPDPYKGVSASIRRDAGQL